MGRNVKLVLDAGRGWRPLIDAAIGGLPCGDALEVHLRGFSEPLQGTCSIVARVFHSGRDLFRVERRAAASARSRGQAVADVLRYAIFDYTKQHGEPPEASAAEAARA